MSVYTAFTTAAFAWLFVLLLITPWGWLALAPVIIGCLILWPEEERRRKSS